MEKKKEESSRFKYVGISTGRIKDLKDRYKFKVDYPCGLFHVGIRKDVIDKTLEVIVQDLETFWEEQMNPLEMFSQCVSICKSPKSVPIKDWVKPDTESLENALLVQLVRCELLEADTYAGNEADIKRDLLYSIINSTSPRNPQTLNNYSLWGNAEEIYKVLGNEKAEYFWNLAGDVMKGKVKYDKKGYRAEHKRWRKEQMDSMITVKKFVKRKEIEERKDDKV